MFLETILLVGLACYLLYYWATANYDFFKNRGIPFHKPFPLLGSMKETVLRKKSMFTLIEDLYKMHDGKTFGVFDQRVPMLLIRDPEIIKQITIKDFDHFINHRSVFKNDDKNLFGNSLFFLQDGKWKDMRSTLSPAFTGSKMRHMFELINEVARDSAMYIKELQKDDDDGAEIDVKDFSTRFTNDIIASTAFGLKVNSYKDKDNEFYKMGKDATTFTAWRNIKFFLYANFGRIMKVLKLEVFEERITDYFIHLVLDTMKYRKEHNISRPDMINMLMEARGMIYSEQSNQKSHNREWTDVEIVAQCFLFFFAGFEPASVLACFTAHELMENPEVQEKLYDEIKTACDKLKGKPLDYETLQSLKYLEMVVSESLRKWPGAAAIDRVCTKDFAYTTNDGETIEIRKGDYIWVPVCGLQRDPKYFPNPNKFDPERFSDENKDDIVPFTYLPFGMGPRNCIGSRLALLEAKALIFYLVKEFNIVAGKKTGIPLELSPVSLQMIPKNGFWLKFIQRADK